MATAGIAGLNIDKTDVLSLPPCVVLYGKPGGGKTTEMARAFQNVLYVQSAPSILHAYAHFSQLNPDLKLRIPERITIDENYVTANGGSFIACLVDILKKYLAAVDAGTSPYEGIVFDEWNVMCERLFAELKSNPNGKFNGRGGNINIFAVFDAFKAYHRAFLSISRRTRKMVGFVSHHQPPKVDEEDGSLTKGQIKWPGGPQMPMGLSSSMIELCAEADVVLQLEVKDPVLAGGSLSLDSSAPAPVLNPNAQRVFLTQLDSKWFRKVRGFGVEREEPLDIHEGKGLRELLRRAGWPV